MGQLDKMANALFGGKRAETQDGFAQDKTATIIGTAVTDSDSGAVMVELSSDVTNPEPVEIDGETYFEDASTAVELPTTQAVQAGDEVLVSVYGGTALKNSVVTGVVGSGDRIAADAEAAREIAEATGQHFWDDTNGAHVTEATREEWEQGQTGPNSLWNSLGMLFRDGLNNLLAIVTGQNPGLQIYDGQGNADENVLAEFTADRVRLGGVYDDGDDQQVGTVQFFDENTSINAEFSDVGRAINYVTKGMAYGGGGLNTLITQNIYADNEGTGTHPSWSAIQLLASNDAQRAGALLHLITNCSSDGQGTITPGDRRIEIRADTVVLDGSDIEYIRGIFPMKQVIEALNKVPEIGRRYQASGSVAINQANTDISGPSITVPAGNYLVTVIYAFPTGAASGVRDTTLGFKAGGSSTYTKVIQGSNASVRLTHLDAWSPTSSQTLTAYVRSSTTSNAGNCYISAIRLN